MWFWARSEGIHHWEPAWELLLTFRWSFERLNISIHLILWCPPWPALLKNKFCSILTFLANLDKKKKIKNVNLARLCARLKPVFLSKKGPSKARLLTKMSSSEELGTLNPNFGRIFLEDTMTMTNDVMTGYLCTIRNLFKRLTEIGAIIITSSNHYDWSINTHTGCICLFIS